MSKAKHRKLSTVERHPLRTWLIASVFVLLGAGLVTACASSNPVQASEEPQQAPAQTEWKPMAVPGLEYACDPVLGIIVKHVGDQTGSGSGDSYKLWTISVTPYSQTTAEQETKMCGGLR
jgi:hypothetical protein